MFYNTLHRLVLVVSVILLLSSTQNNYCQNEQKKLFVIRARLVDIKNRQPIVFAQVINKNMRWGVISDSLGVFSFSANLHDTLYISAIGYYPTLLEVADSLIEQVRIPEIPLVERIYELDQVKIYALGTYQQFKYKVLHNKLPEENTQKINEIIQTEIDKIPKYPLQEQAAIPLGSPITALYMLFSKEGKSLKKFEEAKEQHRVFALVNARFNREIVSQATGLKGDMLDQFMMFCNPNIEFILSANEYEIHLKILQDYERFLKEYKKNSGLIKK